MSGIIDPMRLAEATLLYSFLGPAAKSVGFFLKDIADLMREKAMENVERVFAKAADRIGETELRNGDGGVPLRVLKLVVNEAAITEDGMMAEYLAGILASSRGNAERDDRGVSIATLISQLTTYQVRSHYVFYQAFKQLYTGMSINPLAPYQLTETPATMTINDYFAAMELAESDRRNPSVLFNTLVFLKKQDLIRNYTIGRNGRMDEELNVEWSPLGIELFYWAHGKGKRCIVDFWHPDEEFPAIESIALGRFGYGRNIEHVAGSAHNWTSFVQCNSAKPRMVLQTDQLDSGPR